MPRPQHKRMKERVYRYLEKQNKPLTAHEIISWYMDEYAAGTTAKNRTQVRSGMQNSVPTPADLSNIMRRSLLFECVGKERKDGRVEEYKHRGQGGHNLWIARPLDVVVQRAIASRRPIEKYPAFLRKEIRRVLDAENN